jgi:hypothetical protein
MIGLLPQRGTRVRRPDNDYEATRENGMAALAKSWRLLTPCNHWRSLGDSKPCFRRERAQTHARFAYIS